MGQLFFKKRFQIDIRAGTKRTTIRRWKKPCVVVGRDAYSLGLGWLMIERVEPVDLENLTDADAKADGFATRRELHQTLAALYPEQDHDGKRWFRVVFRLRDPAAPVKKPRHPRRDSPGQAKLFHS